jgi:hypothetical protein
METYTDIAYIKEKNAIQIAGEGHEDVYKAQNQLNTLFFPVVVKSKRQWARPDRPGSWGQRRDTLPLKVSSGFNQTQSQFNGYSSTTPSPNYTDNTAASSYSDHHLRKMKSESALNERFAPPTPPTTPPFDQPPRYQSPPVQHQAYQPPMARSRQSYQAPQSATPWGAPSYHLPPPTSSFNNGGSGGIGRRPQSQYGNGSSYSSHPSSNSQWR